MAGNEDHGEGAGAAEGPVTAAPRVQWRNLVTGEIVESVSPDAHPSDAELEIDLFNALVEVGNLPDSVRVADIDHQAVAQRLAELGWVRP